MPATQALDQLVELPITEFIRKMSLIAQESDWSLERVLRTVGMLYQNKKLQRKCVMALETLGLITEQQDKHTQQRIDSLERSMAIILTEYKGKHQSEKKWKHIHWSGNGRLMYMGQEYIMRKESKYAKVSGIIYTHCKRVGSKMTTSELYRLSEGGDYNVDKEANWQWLYHTIRDANRWAKKQGLENLFSCTKVSVERVL